MYKHIDVGSWDFGIKTAEVIPVSSRGLIASDASTFFNKRAGGHEFAEVLSRIKLAKDEIPIHLTAMGATESYGDNKNFDGFKRAMLQETHPTFVSNAHVFYHHKNKDPKDAFGKVAASLFNDPMDRVELLILLNGSKEAADKNGGKVAPQEDVDILYSGGTLPWSMGISVPFDKCAACGHEAPSPKEYCEQHECIDKSGQQRFGCKGGLGKTADDGFKQYVDNPKGKFKDISRVSTPADRTAYGAIAKYASALQQNIGGAELALARGHVEPEEHFIKTAELRSFCGVLTKLAAIEGSLRLAPEVVASARGFREYDELPHALEKYARTTHEQAKREYLMHLADFNIVLSPRQFAKFAGYKVSEAYPSALKNMFGQLDRAVDNRTPLLVAVSKYASSKRNSFPAFYASFALANSYGKEGHVDRVIVGTMYDNRPLEKVASTPNETDLKAAVEYCLYKIAAIARMDEDLHYVTACIQNL